jgi:hypothetical protein
VKARTAPPILDDGADAFCEGTCRGRIESEASMAACRAASNTLRRSGVGAIRFLFLMVGIVGASAGVAWFLSDPGRIKRPDAVAPRRASPRTDEVTARLLAAPAAQTRILLYSEDWTEDSGQALARRRHAPDGAQPAA